MEKFLVVHQKEMGLPSLYFTALFVNQGDSGISKSWAPKPQGNSTVLQHLHKHASTFGLDVSSLQSRADPYSCTEKMDEKVSLNLHIQLIPLPYPVPEKLRKFCRKEKVRREVRFSRTLHGLESHGHEASLVEVAETGSYTHLLREP